MTIRQAALAATLLLGAATPAFAQYGPAAPTPQAPPPQAQQPAAQQPAQPQRTYNLSRAERTALQPALQASAAMNWQAAEAALPAADAAAQSADAKYVVAQIRLRIGLNTNNVQIQTRAVDDLIASGGALPAELPGLYEAQFDLASAANDRAKAEHALTQLVALNPNSPSAIARVAQFRGAADPAGAIEMYRRAIAAAGAAADLTWRARVVALAYGAHMPETVAYMRELLAVQPTASNWHDALAIYREFTSPDDPLKLDIYRLMRAAGAMTAERDYVEYAAAANGAAVFGEVKTVLEEGLARNLITANAQYARDLLARTNPRVAEDRASLAGEKAAALAAANGTQALRLGDAFFGYGDYGQAIELYRAALQKGGQDAALVNTRLGAALALAGQRAEAEAAFRAVTGPRAELAQLWLVWLATPRA